MTDDDPTPVSDKAAGLLAAALHTEFWDDSVPREEGEACCMPSSERILDSPFGEYLAALERVAEAAQAWRRDFDSDYESRANALEEALSSLDRSPSEADRP